MCDDFVIERHGHVIGKAGAWHLPEIGILVHRDHWGQGIAREALTAILAEIFTRRPSLTNSRPTWTRAMTPACAC